MRDDDIEILDDFQSNSNPNQNINQNGVQNNQVNEVPNNNASISEFEKMVNEAHESSLYQPPEESNALSQRNDFVPDYKEDLNNELDNNFVNDSNNELVKPSEDVQPDNQEAKEQDLTITAVYPDGFVVDQQEELENTQVIKTKKKNKTDIYLLIIVIVLAITLAVLLITSYM